MTASSYRGAEVRITTHRQAGGGWTFTVEIRDQSGHLVKSLASDEVALFTTPTDAENAGERLARTWVDEQARAWRHAEDPMGAFRPDALAGCKVLVVDDDDDTLDLFATILSHWGATVTTANSARTAFQQFVDGPVDIVVSDLSMPGEDGCCLASTLREKMTERGRVVPMLAVTAHGRQYPVQRAMAAGFTAYLGKPIEPDALCEAVARLTRRA